MKTTVLVLLLIASGITRAGFDIPFADSNLGNPMNGLGIFSFNGVPGMTSLVWNATANGEGMDIESMPDLVTIDAPNLVSITGSGYILLAGNSALTNVSGFGALTSLNSGNLTVSGNSALLDVSGFGALTNAGGAIIVNDNPSLVGITGFTSLTTAGSGLSINNNSVVSSISGFSSITSISGTLDASSNPALVSISSFQSLATTGGSLSLHLDTALTNTGGFPALTNVGQTLDTAGCNMAVWNDCGSLLSIGSDFDFNFMGLLTSITGFSSLQTIVGNFYGPNCPLLSNISGFGALASIGGTIQMDTCGLTDITGFPVLTNLGGNFNCNACKLTSTAVNRILAKLVTMNGSTWANSANLSGQTPPAPPTGQGIVDKATLITRGATITTD